MTQAMQMMDSDQGIGAHHSVANQSLLLQFAARGAMFATVTSYRAPGKSTMTHVSFNMRSARGRSGGPKLGRAPHLANPE